MHALYESRDSVAVWNEVFLDIALVFIDDGYYDDSSTLPPPVTIKAELWLMRVAVHDQNEYIKKPPRSHLSLESCPGEVPFDGPAIVDIWAAGVMIFVMLIRLTNAGRAKTI